MALHILTAFGLAAEAAAAASAENVGCLASHSGGVKVLLCNRARVALLPVLRYEADRQRQNRGAKYFDTNGYAGRSDLSIAIYLEKPTTHISEDLRSEIVIDGHCPRSGPLE